MDLFTIRETARMLKVTPITVRRFIAAGRLPALRVGRQVRIRREAIEQILTPVGRRDNPLDEGAGGLEPPTPAELARRRAAVARILAVRAKTPSITPLTTADLLHRARSEAGVDDPGD